MMPQFLIILACVVGICWQPITLAEERICTKEEAIEAEDITTAQSWGQLHQQFIDYAHCDDGAIGEGFSESVSILLAGHWQEIRRLGEMLESDPTFRKFVFRHINGTVPAARLESIVKNAHKQCPQNLDQLCRDIEAAASQART